MAVAAAKSTILTMRLAEARPQDRGGSHRDAHDVENVDLQEVAERTPAQQLRLQAEQKREREDLQPSLAGERRRLPVPDLGGARRGRHRSRESGEEQEERRREAGDEDRIHVERAAAILEPRPRVGDVGADHDDHGDAAKPVEIDLTSQVRPRTWCPAAGPGAVSATPSSTCRARAGWPARRRARECRR